MESENVGDDQRVVPTAGAHIGAPLPQYAVLSVKLHHCALAHRTPTLRIALCIYSVLLALLAVQSSRICICIKLIANR
jgi:hypothetical protein